MLAPATSIASTSDEERGYLEKKADYGNRPVYYIYVVGVLMFQRDPYISEIFRPGSPNISKYMDGGQRGPNLL